MESIDEGQPSPFARPANRQHSPTSLQQMSAGGNGLRLPRHLRATFRAPVPNIRSETQQHSFHDLSVIDQNQISSSLQAATAEVEYVPESILHPTVPQTEHVPQGGMAYTSTEQKVGPYGSYQAANAQSTPIAHNTYGAGLPQPGVGTTMFCSPPFSAAPMSFNHQQYLNVTHPTANLHSHSTTAPSNQIPLPSHVSPPRADQGNRLVAQFANHLPPWGSFCALQSQAAQTEGPYGLSFGNLVPTNSFGRDVHVPQHDSLSPNAPIGGQPTGNFQTQPFPLNIPPSQGTQMTTYVGQAGSDGDKGETAGVGGSLAEYQSQSIDVDNEANNLCGGVNRKVSEEPIELSDDTNELTRLKKKEKRMERAPQQDPPSYRIPIKSGKGGSSLGDQTTNSNERHNDKGNNKSGFMDPLRLPRRSPTGPPPRPFPKPVPENSPVRKSSRQATSKNEKADSELKDSPQKAQSPLANGDVPLGGLGKDAREFSTKTNSFRGRNRANNKRRRPNSGAEVESPKREAGDHRTTEIRRKTTSSSKRRTKNDGGNKKARKQASANPLKRASTQDEAADDDSDGLSEMLRRKTMPIINSRGVPAQSHGDSPLSNTVGDASQSDDDSFNAAGNELSSDEDGDTSAKTPPPYRRKTRKKMPEAITIYDSPVKTRIPRPSKSPRTPRTSQTGRAPKAAQSSQGNVSKIRDVPGISDGEYPCDSPEYCADKSTKRPTTRKPNGKKKVKVSKTLSSPVNLVSPTPSGPVRTDVRRSPRNATKGSISSKQRVEGFGADSSDDDDFTVPGVSARTRRKTKSRTAGNDNAIRSGPQLERSLRQRGTETEGRSNRVCKQDIDTDSMSEEPKSPSNSSNGEDSDIAVEFPSQEQGSQPIDLNVRIVPKRKKAGPKVFREREFNKLSTDELAMIRIAFIKRYPSPPSNLQAQGRYEAAHGTTMTSGMVQKTWETQLKPWSKRWWDFYLDFNTVVREKKAAKPRNKDPTLKEKEVQSWVEEYYQQHGDAKPNVTETVAETIISTNAGP